MKLDLWFLVPGPSAGTLLLAADGSLPATQVDVDENGAAIVPTASFVRGTWALTAPILETHPRWNGVAEGDPIPTLVLTEPARADWTPPAGLGFAPVPPTPGGLPAPIRPRADELLAELRTGAPPPDLRPRWARPGWNTRATAWMRAAAADVGRPLTGEPRPFFLRGISALLRAPTDGPDLFLKAVFPPFHAEPVLTRLLADRFPEAMPRVVAVEPGEGWQLVDDVAAPWVCDLPAADKAAALSEGARTLVRIQRAITAADIDALVAAGSPRRPLAGIADAFEAAAVTDAVAFVEGTVSLERRERAMVATRAAVDRVAALGFPETVVHGDFHAGNAALAEDRVVIIDWSDAAIGNPVFDLVTWLSWSKDEPGDQAAAIDAWIDAWAGVVDPAAVHAALADILIVGAAYQVVSYDGIVRALEPATRYTMAGGATHYLERLEQHASGPGAPMP